jgi:HAE1 family hydrophobic/amphiphilic exporter-1
VSLAVFGGLLTSTILTLCVTPVVYSLVDDLGAFLSRTWRGSRPEAPAGAAEPAS